MSAVMFSRVFLMLEYNLIVKFSDEVYSVFLPSFMTIDHASILGVKGGFLEIPCLCCAFMSAYIYVLYSLCCIKFSIISGFMLTFLYMTCVCRSQEECCKLITDPNPTR